MQKRMKLSHLFLYAVFIFSLTSAGCISPSQEYGTGSVSFAKAEGFYISGRHLLDAQGNEFIIRGISHPHCWYTGRTGTLADIKNTGANTVRIVCSNGTRWYKTSSGQLSRLIDLCKEHRLIALLEVHDTTGYGEDGAACSLSEAVNYWKDMKDILTGEEAYVLINIGNEPYGNKNCENWINDTKDAIQSMREAGFKHTLVVDSPNWGQDWSHTMRDNAQAIIDADPDRNVLLSVHMYGVYNTESKVRDYISYFTGMGLPLLIGEFGHNHTDGDPDEDAIMLYAETSGTGYIGWSWCGNSSDVSFLDMVISWKADRLTTWGDRIINGKNGIKATSRECSVYKK
jgi:mannan endo-1,4-beta-mannosidase